MLNFRDNHFYLAGCLLCVEVFSAALLQPGSSRLHVGDLVAVIFLYCFVQSLVAVPTGRAVLAVLLGAYVVEASQYFHLVAHLGLQHSSLALVVLGSHFEWQDVLAYTLAALLIVGVEYGHPWALRKLGH